jgi:hypothetical protein
VGDASLCHSVPETNILKLHDLGTMVVLRRVDDKLPLILR